jgi:hypothetical protein
MVGLGGLIGAEWIIRGVVIVYFVLFSLAMVFAWWWPDTRGGKWFAVAVVAALFGGMPATGWIQDAMRRAEFDRRYSEARQLFEKRCKTAGVKIHRTVQDVDGIFIIKVRPKITGLDLTKQFEMDDPYGNDLDGEAYIKSFLKGNSPRGKLQGVEVGYDYVEAIDPEDGKRYRYTGGLKEVEHVSSRMGGGDGVTKFKTMDFVMDRVPATGPSPRYGVTYDDISTRQEREHWIAGSSLRVVDLQTGEVIAERIGYLMDEGLGSRAGFRTPWLRAASDACPSFQVASSKAPGFAYQTHQTLRFVEKVLYPHKGD